MRRKTLSSLSDLVRWIKLNRLEDYYIPVLRFIIAKKVVRHKDIVNDKDFKSIRAVLTHLVGADVIIKHRSFHGVVYIATKKTEKLLKELLEKKEKQTKFDPKKIIDWGVYEWILQTLRKLKEQGYTKFSKGLFFHTLYSMIEELEKQGFIVNKPKLVSVDRMLRHMVEVKLLYREGTHKNPIYVINEKMLEEFLK